MLQFFGTNFFPVDLFSFWGFPNTNTEIEKRIRTGVPQNSSVNSPTIFLWALSLFRFIEALRTNKLTETD